MNRIGQSLCQALAIPWHGSSSLDSPPAAHGGNRTGRAFTGDRSGEWLYGALYAHGFANQPISGQRDDGLTLHDCFITQVLHCAPPENKPARQEIDRCQSYMLTELRLLPNVRVIVPLGKIAFDTILRAYRTLAMPLPRPLPRFGHGVLSTLPIACSCCQHIIQANRTPRQDA